MISIFAESVDKDNNIQNNDDTMNLFAQDGIINYEFPIQDGQMNDRNISKSVINEYPANAPIEFEKLI